MLFALITLNHFSPSAFMCAANFSGAPPAMFTLTSSSRLRMRGFCSAVLNAAFSVSTAARDGRIRSSRRASATNGSLSWRASHSVEDGFRRRALL